MSRGSVYQRKDGRWVGCAEVSTEDGKRKRKYVYADSSKEAQRKLNKLVYEIENSLFVANDSVTLKALLEEWYVIHKPKLATTTAELYRMYIDKHIVPEIGSFKLKDLKPNKIDRFYNKKLESLSPNTVRKIHNLLHQGLEYAIKNDAILSNPTDKVDLPQKTPVEYSLYDEKKFNTLLEKVYGTFDEIPILLAGAVGLRRGEVFGLRWSDINFENKTISITETNVRWNKYVTKGTKTESSKRTIMVYDFVLEALKRYRDSCKIVNMRVCDRYKPDAYSKRFKKLLIDNELYVIRFHDLRHYNAIIMLKYGIPDIVAAERLGHSDTSMLKKVYQHTLSDMHVDAADKLESVFSNKKEGIK